MGPVLFKAGLVVLGLAIAIGLFADSISLQFGGNAPAIMRLGLWAGGGLCLVGAVAWLLGRGASALGQRRCARCGRPVSRGATYCMDHMRESVEQAKERGHRHYGSGV
jgi:hypothetical protein